MTERQAEALEKLNQGIEESRRTVQQQTMQLAQDYFVNSAEALKDQIKDNRSTLESLPDQIPGGREEAFQAMFQELMENYSKIEGCLEEAQQNVSDLDTDQIRRQGEIEATDAARREARERGVDLTKIKGTGSDGRIIYSDVVEAAEAMEDGAGGEESEVSEDGAAGEVVQQAQDAAGQAAGQGQQAVGQATGQAGQVAGQAQDVAGNAVGQAQDAAGGAAQQVSGTLGGVTDQVGQVAEQAQDTAGGAVQQAQETAGQATDQAAGGSEEPRATNAARRRAEEMGVDLSQVQGTGAGGLITLRDVTGS